MTKNNTGIVTQFILLSALSLISVPAHAELDTGVFTQYAWDESAKGRALDLTGYTETFRDEFDQLGISDRTGPGPWFGGTRAGYGDVRFLSPSSSGPFFLKEAGVLTIRAQRQSDGSYTSGYIQTVDVFDRGYLQSKGYFEIKAKFPTGAGFWPAFWLRSRTSSAFPRATGVEIDAIEWYGGDPKGLHQAMHYWPANQPLAGEPTTHMATSNYSGYANNGADTGFHTYGVEITDKWLIYYFDRKEVIRHPLLKHFDEPLYPIVSLGVYDKSVAPSSGEMKVDYVRTWAKNEPGHRAFESLLVNGTFEIGSFSYWGSNGSGGLAEDATPIGTSKLGRVGTGAGSVYQDIQSVVDPGQTYQLTAIARVGSSGETASVGTVFSTDSGVVAERSVPVKSTSYAPVSFSFTVPTSPYVRGRIVLTKAAGTSYAFLDDVALERQIFPKPTTMSSIASTLVANPGFESALNSWTNWGASTTVTTAPAAGTRALRVGPGKGGVGQDLGNRVSAGKRYRLDMKAKLGVAQEPAWVGVKFYNSSGGLISTTAKAVSGTSFGNYQIDFVVPTGATRTWVWYWKDLGAGSYLYGDEVKVTPL